MKELPCILWYATDKKKQEDLELLKQISVAQKISEKNLADYTAILAHTYNIFERTGYSLEEIQNYNLPGKKNYCNLREKASPEHLCLCQTCEYSRKYLGGRKEQEKTVLYYLLDHNSEVMLYQGIEKNMFASKEIIKQQDKYGKWPILKFHQEIYNFIFISSFSGITVRQDNFTEKFMQYLYAILPGISENWQRAETELEAAFIMKAEIFAGGYRKIEETEYEKSLNIIKNPYKFSIENRKKQPENKEEPKSGENKKELAEKTAFEERNMAEPDSACAEIPKTGECWFEKYPLPVKKEEIFQVSPEYMASLVIRLIRAEHVIIEAGMLEGQAGLLVYPLYAEKMYFTDDREEMKNILEQVTEKTFLLCFDIKKLTVFFREQGVRVRKQIESVSVLYYLLTGQEQRDTFEVMAGKILQRNLSGLHNVLMGEYRLYAALSENLDEVKQPVYRRRLAFESALSCSCIREGDVITDISECHEMKNVPFRTIRIELKEYGKWKELMERVISNLWVMGAFDSFQMHLGETGNDYAVFRYLSGKGEELRDLFCQVFHTSMKRETDRIYEMKITEVF